MRVDFGINVVFYQLYRLSLVVPALSLDVPGWSLAVPGLTLAIPGLSLDVPGMSCISLLPLLSNIKHWLKT